MSLHYKPMYYVQALFFIISLQFEYLGLLVHAVDILIENLSSGIFFVILKA